MPRGVASEETRDRRRLAQTARQIPKATSAAQIPPPHLLFRDHETSAPSPRKCHSKPPLIRSSKPPRSPNPKKNRSRRACRHQQEFHEHSSAATLPYRSSLVADGGQPSCARACAGGERRGAPTSGERGEVFGVGASGRARSHSGGGGGFVFSFSY